MSIESTNLEAAFQTATALQQSGQLKQAEAMCLHILKSDPQHFNALNLLAVLHLQAARYQQAVQYFERAIAVYADHPPLFNNYGIALERVGQPDKAVAAYDRAIALQPLYPQAFNNRGVALTKMNQTAKALTSFQQAIRLRPDFADAHKNVAASFKDAGDVKAAAQHYSEAARLRPDDMEAHFNLGMTLNNLNQHEAALRSYATAQALAPTNPFILGVMAQSKMRICDWTHFDAETTALCQAIERGAATAPPFALLAITDNAAVHRKATELWVQQTCPESPVLGALPKCAPSDKIKVGYFSMDFRDHPVAQLSVELFENHDASSFEVTAFSFSDETGDEMQARLKRAFPTFIDVRGRSDQAVAALAREMGLDIAVDLAGHTIGARPGIFAARAAPVQVSYLGFPGTFGATYMDYVLADRTVIPEHQQTHYVEKIAYLPHSYQANAAWRAITAAAPSRTALSLPENAFVFCCFNNNHKITPDVFASWMRILTAVEHSVLWLLADNEIAARNLRAAAMQRGVAADRLIFAPRTARLEHLSRQRAADVFLDTLPYNAHTTASDALRYGLPVLTCAGEAFAGRVAASLLATLGLPELITTSLPAYEARAIELATTPSLITSLRERLRQNASVSVLFDPVLFARHVEDLYRQMRARSVAALPPDHLVTRLSCAPDA